MDDKIQEGLKAELAYWSKRRRLLKAFRAEILPHVGKTETTVRLGQSITDAANAIMEHDQSDAARQARIGWNDPDTPEYRVRVPGARVLRIGTIGIDAAIKQAESKIEACDIAVTYNYDRLLEIDRQIAELVEAKRAEQANWPTESRQAYLRWQTR